MTYLAYYDKKKIIKEAAWKLNEIDGESEDEEDYGVEDYPANEGG